MMYTYSSMSWTHAHIYSWKLGPGLVLLAKVCPWSVPYRVHETRGNGGSEDDAESHRQGPAHVEELVTRGSRGDRRQTAHHSGGVPSCPGQDRAAQEADGSDDRTQNHAVANPN